MAWKGGHQTGDSFANFQRIEVDELNPLHPHTLRKMQKDNELSQRQILGAERVSS